MLSSVLPTLLRSIRHPGSSLTALLALTSRQSNARAAAMFARTADSDPRLIAVGGADAGKLGRLETTAWVSRYLTTSGSKRTEPSNDAPWKSNDQVVWRSAHGQHSLLTLIAYGTAPDEDVIEELASPSFLLAELTLARGHQQELEERLKLERQERALLAASLQHDLRTPLSGILGFARVLRQEEGLDPKERSEILDTIISEAEHMAAIVEEGLRREEAGPDTPPKLQPVSPREIAENVAEAATRARPGEVVFDVQEGTFISDDARLTRALLNLVDNALKYSPTNSPVRVRGEFDGNHYTFDIADQGPGVPDEMVPTLFQPYSTDPSRVDGTGLGLHSVATIAAELGGRVCYARRDGWTIFTLSVATLSHRKSQVPASPDLSDVAS